MVGEIEWSFENYLEEIYRLSANSEADAERSALTEEMWEFYPKECVMIGLGDRV